MNMQTELEAKCPVFAQIGEDEKQSVMRVLSEAEQHGYGNMMAWLLTAWNIKLHPQMPNLPDGEYPMPVREQTPYPISF